MHQQGNVDNPKLLMANGIMFCCLSLTAGSLIQLIGFPSEPLRGLSRNLFILTIDRDPEDIACVIKHQWRSLHGGDSKIWLPWLEVSNQLLRAKQLQRGLVSLSREQLIERFGLPDCHWTHTYWGDEIMFWDLGGSVQVKTALRNGVCFNASMWRNW